MIFDFKEFNKYKFPTDFEKTFDNFMKVNGVNESTVTDDMMDWYAYHICDIDGYFDPHNDFCDSLRFNSFVDEMLEKTSIDFLKKQLNIGLGAGKDYKVINQSDNDDMVNILWISPEIYDRDKVMKICDKSMWAFTSVLTKNKQGETVWKSPMENEPYVEDYVKIKVEPIKTKNITDFVKNNCGGKIYHICPTKNLEWILKSGLRIKGEKNSYRYIKNRVYFFCGETKDDILDNLAEVAMTKYAWDTDTGWLTDDYTLLEIDVNGYNINFYQDGYYFDSKKYIGYTYNYFPPKRLRVVDVYDLKDDYEDPNW